MIYDKIIAIGEVRGDHFYQYFRYIWFGWLIFTIDVYPREVHFGIMRKNSVWQRKLLVLR